MRPGIKHIEYRRLRPPREDRAVLMDPEASLLHDVIAANSAVRRGWQYDFQGKSLVELSHQARRELVSEARRWTSAYRDVDPVATVGRTGDSTGDLTGDLTDDATDRRMPIFLAGHQPQLFHPGVWFKNLALGAMAQTHGALAINLIIDSDTMKANALRVPGGSIDQPHADAIPFDSAGRSIPFEERGVADRQVFADFGRRVQRQIAPLVPNPLVRQYWPMVLERLRQTDNLGACLAQSRHQLEGQWGWKTLEVPQSRICQTESHGWFVAHLLAQLPRFREDYNAVVGEYRRAHRIRSAAHPVPDLGCDGPWLEAPFWVWTVDDPRRRPLWVKHEANEILLTDRHALKLSLPLSADSDAAGAVQRLMDLAGEGVKIRSRALITTLWARLVLGDLFVHGIGGAKYDQVTDALLVRFFGLEPPHYLVLSATLHLPVPKRPERIEDLRAIRHRLRTLTFHPECSINGALGNGALGNGALGNGAFGDGAVSPKGSGGNFDQGPGALIAEKSRWIHTPQTPQNARTRYREIRRVNQALQPWVVGQREELLGRLDRVTQAIGDQDILSWREYGFCLHPEETLRDFFDGLLSKIA